MDRAVIDRLETGDEGTFGRIWAKGLSFFTGELPDRGNAPNISCITAATFHATWSYSPRFGRYMYLIGPVPGRSGIREHAANLMGDIKKGLKSQLNGCIALGERLGWIDGQKALLLSRPAIRRFENLMERKPFILEVGWSL